MIYAWAQGVRKFKTEINSFSADAADFLRCVNLFLVGIELSLVRAVAVWAILWLCHIPPPQGIKIALARDIHVLSKCLFLFKFYAALI